MIAILIGTRPELIKMAPVLRSLKKTNIPHIFIHSNQHYSVEMDQQIIEDLDLAKPDFELHVGSGTHAVQTGQIMAKVEEVLGKTKTKIVLVHGDTNTSLAGGLTAKKMHLKVGHVEAGLRSYDYNMPEEINRVLVDRISDFLFAPTEEAKQNLLREGLDTSQITVTGNTVVDALFQHLPLAKKSSILSQLKLIPEGYLLVTAHRPETVDDKRRLLSLIKLLEYAQTKLKLPIIWPIHPRSQKQLDTFKIKLPKGIKLITPVGYIDMLALMQGANMILTDSGGIQEEAFILRKPLVTLRTSTERPETLTANFIVDLNKSALLKAINSYKHKLVSWTDVFGQGNASEKIIKVLKKELNG